MSEPSEEAIHIAARVWCDQSMSHVTMDIEAVREIAVIVDRVLKQHNKKEQKQ